MDASPDPIPLHAAKSATDRDPALLAGLPVVVLRLDRDGAIVALTRPWESMTGCSVAESLGRPWRTFIDAGDQGVWRAMEAALLSGELSLGDATVRLPHRDGTLRLVEVRCVLLHSAEGETTGIGGTLLDVTGRAAASPPAARALRLTEDSTRSLVERAAFGVFRCTPEGELLDVNPAMSSMLGYTSPGALLGINLFQELGPSLEERDRALAKLAAGASEASCELHGRRHDGTTVHVRLAVTAELDRDRGIRFLQGMAENITERSRREEVVRRGERMAALARTLAGVAHEINNPLAAITGFAQILLKREQLPEDRHALETILHEARRSAQIVRDLLTIARRQEGSERVRVDINAIVKYLVDTQRYAMETRGIHSSVQLAVEAPRVMADPAQMEQVVLNLMVNARQALELRSESRGADDSWVPTLELSTRVSHGSVILEVGDNGAGIPPRDLPHIWDPFWTTRGEGEGAGLGLSVVQSIVVSHGGTIEATSIPSIATRFTITLPAAAPAAPSPRLASTRPVGSGTRGGFAPLDILVVDDEAVIRELLLRYLALRGHAVVSAESGEQALRLAERGSFDVILSDLRMPGMDGRALIRRLRTLPSCAKTRFILSTGDATAAPDRSGSDSTADVQVVTKPYDVDALVDVVEGR